MREKLRRKWALIYIARRKDYSILPFAPCTCFATHHHTAIPLEVISTDLPTARLQQTSIPCQQLPRMISVPDGDLNYKQLGNSTWDVDRRCARTITFLRTGHFEWAARAFAGLSLGGSTRRNNRLSLANQQATGIWGRWNLGLSSAEKKLSRKMRQLNRKF